MRRRNKTKVYVILGTIVIGIVTLIAFTYAITKFIGLPIDLPFMAQEVLAASSISEVEPIINSWVDPVIYEPVKVEEPEPVVEEMEEPEPVVEKTKFDDLIVLDTLKSYLDGHPEATQNGYDNMFIDGVTINNSGLGIKTIKDDDVLGLDNYDGVMVTSATFGETGSGKLAFVMPDSLDLGVVENLNYWKEIGVTASDLKAVFAINASDYVWNNTYDCGNVTGLIKRNGDIIRKARNTELVVGLDENKKLVTGNVDAMSIGIEGTTSLIKDGNSLFNIEAEGSEEKRDARTAIGTTSSGMIVFAIADSKSGATITEMIQTLQKYNVTDAVMLGCGNRSIMYWNGNIVTNTDDGDGLKLPTIWYVKSVYANGEVVEKDNITSEISENALNVE